MNHLALSISNLNHNAIEKNIFTAMLPELKIKIRIMLQVLLTSIEKIYNSIKYNGFYILMSLIFPVIIWKFDAGEEIIISMTETAFWPNIILSIAAFAGLAFSVWCIPTLAIKFFQFVANYRDKEDKVKNQQIKICLFKQLIFVYNGLDENDTKQGNIATSFCISTAKKRLQIAMRYFALAPWILFILSCIKIFLKDLSYIWLIVVLAFAVIVFLVWFIDNNKEYITNKFRKVFVKRKTGEIQAKRFNICIIVAVIAIALSWTLFLTNNTGKYNSKYLRPAEWSMILLHTIFLLVSYGFIIYMENEKFIKETAYKISNASYKALIIFLVLCITGFYFFNEAQLIRYISPINIIIIIATVLIVFFEFLFTSQHLLISIIERLCTAPAPATCLLIADKSDTNRLKGYKYLLFGLLFFLIFQFFFSSLNSHRIRVENSSAHINKQRPSLTDYFNNWFESRQLLGQEDSVVYLISGQGGGSRAAAHFFMSMCLFEKADSNFFKKVFCISTASGSTSGAEMFLASKYYHQRFTDNNFIKQKGIELYGENYMSSAFFGMMVGDGIEYFTSLNDNFPHDRNYHLQKEELAGFNRAFPKSGTKFFENDFMYPYSDPANHWPLFMINTTVVDYGVRGIFSPVTTNFSLARDLYGDFIKDNCNDKRDIPLVTCVNQSQAFPLLSAYNYLECTGRLADGGIVENTGCATTLEVYEAIRQYCNKTNRKSIKIVCLNLHNSNLDENFSAPYKKASVLNTVTAVIHSPFDGAQFYAHKNLSKKIAYLDSFNLGVNHQDTVWNFGLDTAVTLTRTLSKISVIKIFDKIKDTGKYKYNLPVFYKQDSGQ